MPAVMPPRTNPARELRHVFAVLERAERALAAFVAAHPAGCTCSLCDGRLHDQDGVAEPVSLAADALEAVDGWRASLEEFLL
jgi:hypothetical protein